MPSKNVANLGPTLSQLQSSSTGCTFRALGSEFLTVGLWRQFRDIQNFHTRLRGIIPPPRPALSVFSVVAGPPFSATSIEGRGHGYHRSWDQGKRIIRHRFVRFHDGTISRGRKRGEETAKA